MRIFFDISDIVYFLRYSATSTGIQRAAISIITHSLEAAPGTEIYVAFSRPGSAGYRCCRARDVAAALEAFDRAQLARLLGIEVKGSMSRARYLQRFKKRPLKYRLERFKLACALLAGHERYLTRRGINPRIRWGNPMGYDHNSLLHAQPVLDVAEPGDRLCCLGALWGYSDVQAHLQACAAAGMRLVVMVHDLIPLKLPETTYRDTAAQFYRWLTDARGQVAAFLANSRATAADLEAFLQAPQGASVSPPPVYTVPLAQAMLPAKPPAPLPAAEGNKGEPDVLSPDVLSPAVRAVIAEPYVLSVGTVEPRKNFRRLTEAWHQLAQDPALALPRLVIAGRRGWQCDDLLEQIAAGGRDRVVYVEAPSDRELACLYRSCEFSALVSLYEGWGLPVGESLSYGKTALVSDVSALPEVGGDMVAYCDPQSVDSIAAVARRLIAEPGWRTALEARITRTRLRAWSDVAHDVCQALADCPPRAHGTEQDS